MIKFKSFPRCQEGDMVLDGDRYGWFLQCLQCAHIVDFDNYSPTDAPLSKAVSKTVLHGSQVAIAMRL